MTGCGLPKSAPHDSHGESQRMAGHGQIWRVHGQLLSLAMAQYRVLRSFSTLISKTYPRWLLRTCGLVSTLFFFTQMKRNFIAKGNRIQADQPQVAWPRTTQRLRLFFHSPHGMLKDSTPAVKFHLLAHLRRAGRVNMYDRLISCGCGKSDYMHMG